MRCIIHLDMDCFYAQVERLRLGVDPERPLGVRQGPLLVTCDYGARARGLRKCMPAEEAMRVCPDLLVVPGEDLRPYRAVSDRIAGLLDAYGCPVERAGLDETFVDVTEMLEGTEAPDARDGGCGCPAGAHEKIAAGARLAAEMRARLRGELGLSCCAGVAHNKTLAKLVCGLRKPDSQTAAFPCEAAAFVASLDSVRALPGVGPRTAERLRAIGVETVPELRAKPAGELRRRLGRGLADRLSELGRGEDGSPVRPAGLPKSVGAEESFGPVRLMREVERRLDSLAGRLLALAAADSRPPNAVRLTVRKCDRPGGPARRQTRQRRVSPSLLGPDARPALLRLALDLFEETVDLRAPFRLTLLGLAFTRLGEARRPLAAGLAVQSPIDLRNDAEAETAPADAPDRRGPPEEPDESEDDASPHMKRLKLK